MLLAHVLFVFWLLACWSAGLRVWHILRIDTDALAPWLRHITAANTGLGISVLATLALGLLDLLHPFALAVALSAMLASGFPLLRNDIVDVFALLRDDGKTLRIPKHVVLLVAASVVTVSFGWLLGTVPPVFFDTLVYHLGLPQQYVVRGGIPFTPSMFSALPANAEMLYTLGLGLGDGLGDHTGESTARLLSWWLAVSCALTAGGWCNDRCPGSGWLAVPLVAAMPMVLSLGAHNLSDHAAALFLLQGAALALAWRDHSAGGLMWLAGFFGGLVMGTKYTGLYHVAPGMLLLLVLKPKTTSWGAHAKPVIAAALVALAVASPWYIRNTVHTGNPVYPAFYSVLGGAGWSEESAQKVAMDSQRGAGDGLSLTRVATLPWKIMFGPPKYGAFGDLGHGYWLLLLAAAYALRRSRAGRGLALFALCVLPFWLATAFNLRYILPLFVLTQCGAAVGLARVLRRGPIPAALVSAAVLGITAGNLWTIWTVENEIFHAGSYLSGELERDAFITRAVSYYPAAQAINDKLPKDSRILLIGDTRPYYFQRPVLSSSAYDTAVIVTMVRSVDSLDALECRLAQEGMTHIAYNTREIQRLTESYDYFSWEPQHQALFDGLRTRLKPLASVGPVSIYALAQPPAHCRVSP